MNNQLFKNKILPFLVAIVVFITVSAVFFAPVFQGKILVQSDVQNFMGMSKEAIDYRNATGNEALWTNSMFGGMPTYQISMSQTGNIFEKVNLWLWLGIPRPANYMFLACLMFFILLRSFKVNNWISIVGGLAYGLSTFFITVIVAGHNPQANAMCYIPLALAGINYIFKNNYILGAALLLLGTALEFAVNHIQVTYYMFIIIGCWVISEGIYAIKNKTLLHYIKNVALIAGITVAAIATNTTRLWTTYEYGNESIRGGAILSTAKDSTAQKQEGLAKDYTFQWSYGVGETFTLLYPNFAGGGGSQSFLTDENSNTTKYFQQLVAQKQINQQQLSQLQQFTAKYWGALPFTSGPVYIGAIICFLFLMGAFLAEGKLKWWMIGATIVSIFLAWGKYFPLFNDFFFYHFPLYDKFRTVMMALTIACFTIPLLAIIMLDKYLAAKSTYTEKQKLNALKWSAIIIGVFTLIMLAPTTFFNLQNSSESSLLANNNNSPVLKGLFDALKQDRISMIRTDALRTLFFIAVIAALLWVYIKRKLDYRIVVGVTAILLVIDMGTIDTKYVSKDNFKDKDYYTSYFAKNLPKINDKDPDYRVLNTTIRLDQDGFTPYGFKSIGGYHGAKLQRFQDVIDGYLNKGNEAVINMLNTKYVIGSQQGKYVIQQNPGALGNAWFIDTIQLVDSEDKEFAGLNNFNPKTTAVVNKEFASQIKSPTVLPDSSATIKLKTYNPNQITYSYTSTQDAPIIFSEIWYRGNTDWKAYIDGKYVDHFRANYLLRGIWAPAGNHEITFTFDPPSYESGKKISTASSSLFLLFIIAGLLFEAWKCYKNNSVEIPKQDK